MVYTTLNGGESWGPYENRTSLNLYSLNDSLSWMMSYETQDREIIQLEKTGDGGQTWNTISRFFSIFNGQISDLHSIAFVDENTGFAVGDGGRIRYFSEEGDRRKIKSGTSLPLKKLVFVDEKFGLICGGYSNEEEFLPIMLVSKDGGYHWDEAPYLPYLIHDMYFIDSLHGFAVGEDEKNRGIILETTDKAKNWHEVTFADTLSGPIRALHFKDGTGWAVGQNSLILKYESPITSIQDHIHKSTDTHFQNYPNPFHSKTTISYQLPATTDVELSIFDLSGRKVSIMLKESQAAGRHEVEWNAEDIQPGVYICELKTSMGNQVIKMILTD